MKTAPYELLRAQNLALSTFQTQPLKTAERLVLFALVGHINLKNPTAAIYAKKETLAEEVGKSSPTVWRALSSLISRGLITKSENQSRHHKSGRFGSSLYSFTINTLESLGLRPKPPRKETAEANTSPYVKKPGVPEDLHLLKERLSDPAIFKLMKMATDKKKRLSDIVTVKMTSIVKLRGVQLFALLRYFICRDEDFTAQAKEVHHKKAVFENNENNKKMLISFVIANSGKRFSQGKSIYRVDSTSPNQAFVVDESGSKERWTPITISFVNDVIAGRLTPHVSRTKDIPNQTTTSLVKQRLAMLRQAISSSK